MKTTILIFLVLVFWSVLTFIVSDQCEFHRGDSCMPKRSKKSRYIKLGKNLWVFCIFWFLFGLFIGSL